MEDYPELRDWLSHQMGFESTLHKSASVCTIKNNNAMTALCMLDLNNKIAASTIIIVMPDGSYKEFWLEVQENQILDVPYHERLESYSTFFFVF